MSVTSILEAKKLIEDALLRTHSRVTGVGLSQDRKSIVVYMESLNGYCDSTGIPSTIAGYPVMISCMDRLSPGIPGFLPQNGDTEDFCNVAENAGTMARDRFRPVCGGISAAHYRVGAGTIGIIVNDAITGEPLLLSNNHVFANMSSLKERRAIKGDPILQPSPSDGGTISDTVAYLERWIPYDVHGDNLVDAAVARPAGGMITSKVILGDDDFVTPRKMVSVTRPTKVRKYGRTGGMTLGEVIDWDFSTVMPYPCGITVKYVDQLLVKINTCAGDSGSIYLDENNNIIGLHAGGTVVDGTRYAVANKIKNVSALLGLLIY